MTMRALAVLTLVLLTGCGAPTQILMEPQAPALRLRPAVTSVEVRDISLPRYAAADAVVIRSTGNTVQELSRTVWADTPERAMTLQLAGNLATITGAQVAAEPWPFAGLPGAQVSVRVEHLIGTFGGSLRLTGQYAIAPVGVDFAGRLRRFDIVVPLPGEDPADLARAQGAALAELSETIARDLSR